MLLRSRLAPFALALLVLPFALGVLRGTSAAPAPAAPPASAALFEYNTGEPDWTDPETLEDTSNQPPEPHRGYEVTEGDPVQVANGQFVMTETDLEIAGRGFDFSFNRTTEAVLTAIGRSSRRSGATATTSGSC